MSPQKAEFTIVTVSIGYNHFLRQWSDAVSRLEYKPKEIIIGIDQIDIDTKRYIDENIENVTYIYLNKKKTIHYGEYYNELINRVQTEWVCKIDADDLIFPDAYNNLPNLDADIFAFGCTSTATNEIFLPPPVLSPIEVLQSKHNLLSSLSPFKKYVWEKNNFLDFYFDDWIFWLDAAKENFKIQSSLKSNYFYRDHKNQATKKIDLLLETSKVNKYRLHKLLEFIQTISNSDKKKYYFFHGFPLENKDFGLTLDLAQKLSIGKVNDVYLSVCDGTYTNYCPTNENMDKNICNQCINIQKNAHAKFDNKLNLVDFNFYLKNSYSWNLPSQNSASEMKRWGQAAKRICDENDIDLLVSFSSFVNSSDQNQITKIVSALNPSKSIVEIPREDQYNSLGINRSFGTRDLIFNGINLRTNLELNFSREFDKIQLGFKNALTQLDLIQSSFILKIILRVSKRFMGLKSFVKKFFKNYKIIYDFGANSGNNLAYYLSKASKVIAVEANPVLCDLIRKKFSKEIKAGHLILLNRVVLNTSQDKTKFYIHTEKNELSTFIEPSQEDASVYQEIRVDSISASQLISEYGFPHFIKIDLEGADFVVLSNLIENRIFPRYLSIEIHDGKIINLMSRHYSNFKFQISEYMGVDTPNNFNATTAGLFGEELTKSWLSKVDLGFTISEVGLGWKDLHIRNLFYMVIFSRLSHKIKSF